MGVHPRKCGRLICSIDIPYYASFSGGNLAAIVALKAPTLTPPVPILFQLLIVPVIDNTASASDRRYASWRVNANTAWLPAEHMAWFREHYLPHPEDRVKWDSSPIFAPDDLLSKAPRAWIAVAEMDILRDEGIAYGEKLAQAGVEVVVKVYEKAPHPIIVLDGMFFNWTTSRGPLMFHHCTCFLATDGSLFRVSEQVVLFLDPCLKYIFQCAQDRKTICYRRE